MNCSKHSERESVAHCTACAMRFAKAAASRCKASTTARHASRNSTSARRSPVAAPADAPGAALLEPSASRPRQRPPVLRRVFGHRRHLGIDANLVRRAHGRDRVRHGLCPMFILYVVAAAIFPVNRKRNAPSPPAAAESRSTRTGSWSKSGKTIRVDKNGIDISTARNRAVSANPIPSRAHNAYIIGICMNSRLRFGQIISFIIRCKLIGRDRKGR